ncbi:hypothetical protein JQX13_39830 [Archangium violaceum]|uniref:hypothetical protein n=1 Tax=Archangium violaceum TaxID=83451 RepID=UPI00193C6FAB|nr:hypothetical protein [Archangium violaceum]QRK06212.1 hypothetical protein JQX13_39830 [Archangium violaceum]
MSGKFYRDGEWLATRAGSPPDSKARGLSIWSFDTETHRKRPGLIAPPLVCGSIATREPGSERLLDKAQARHFFSNTIADPDVHIVGANLAFDLGVMAADNLRLIEPIREARDNCLDPHRRTPEATATREAWR